MRRELTSPPTTEVPTGFAGWPSTRNLAPVNGIRFRHLRGWLALWTLCLIVGCSGKPETVMPAKSTGGSASTPDTAMVRSNPPASAPGKATEDDGPVYHLSHAQPKLKTTHLRIGANEMDAEVCRTITEISTGLMFRPGIGPDDGMIFLFNGPHQPAFYMKNVNFDIDVAYIDPEGVILEIVRLKAQDRTPVAAKSDRVQFVLEAAPEYFAKRNLGPGTLIMTDRGSLKGLLLGR